MSPTDTTAPAYPVCQCCPRRLLRSEVGLGRLVCRLCEQRLYTELGEIEILWVQLPGILAPGTAPTDSGGDAPRAPGPSGSRPPTNLAVLSLLGGGVTQPLLAEEDAWRQELRKGGHYPLTPFRGDQDQTLAGTVEWLRMNLLWACHSYPDVDDLHHTLNRVLGDMREAVTGDRRRREELAPGCPMPARGHDDEDQDAPQCGGTLTYDPRKTLIRCGSCRRTYGPTEWDRLGAAAGLITLPFTATAA
ncbi:hypothetical protein ACFVY4_26850 [Streptomyces sp. NPDC058299]|uniref:hypothetical protein n=1 Tax=Streptomyces sp. NPDC058299 TaxID=3346435 RepID=UPI0036EA9B6C